MKMSELWVAAGGSALTCSVANHRLGGYSAVVVKAAGAVTEASQFVANIIVAGLDSGDYAYCVADLTELSFIEDNDIGEESVDLLMKIVSFALSRKMKVAAIVDNTILKEVLAGIFSRGRGHPYVTVFSSEEWASSQFQRALACDGLIL